MNQLKLWIFTLCVYLTSMSWFLNSWISIWMTMEVSVLFLIGLMSIESGYGNSSFMMKFFIIQLLISLTFMFSILIYTINFFLNCSFVCFVLLGMKMGLFPFHFWLIGIVGKMNWLSFVVLSTFMKLPPLSLMHYLVELNSLFIVIVIASSSIMGSWLGINNVTIQKLLSYSSMTHLCWIILSLTLSLSIYWLYFFSYLITLGSLSLIFYKLNMFYLNQFKLSFYSKFYSFSFLFIILSLGGFPPFMGFLMKWILGSFMLLTNLKLAFIFIFWFSFLSVMFYFQMFYYFILVFSIGMKWHFNSLTNQLMFKLMFFILTFYMVIYFCI